MSDFTLQDWIDLFLQVVDKLPITLLMLVLSLIFSLILSVVIAVIRIHKVKVLYQLSTLYLSFTRATPLLVQIFLVYFGLPEVLLLFNIDINGFDRLFFAILAFTLHTAAYLSEIVRGAYLAVGKAQ